MKTTQTIYNRLSKNSVLAGSQTSYVENGIYVLTNLEETIMEKVNLPNGAYEMISGKLYRIGEYSEDRVIPKPFEENLSIPKQFSLDVLELSQMVGNDELRPIMNAILFDKENVVSTDAHIMRWKQNQTSFQGMIKPYPAMLDLMKKVDFTLIWEDEKSYMLESDEVKYIFNKVEGQYPNYKAVIPAVDSYTKAFRFEAKAIKDFAKVSKGINEVTNSFVKVENNLASLVTSNIENSIKESIPIEMLLDIPKAKASGLIMPIALDNKTNQYEFGFQAKRLVQLLGSAKSITIALNSPNKALLSWVDEQPTEIKKTQNSRAIKAKKAIKAKPEPIKAKIQPIKAKIQIIEYSEKAIVVHGETKPIKEALKSIGGRWNKFLSDADGNRFAGWVFSKRKSAEVEKLVNML